MHQASIYQQLEKVHGISDSCLVVVEQQHLIVDKKKITYNFHIFGNKFNNKIIILPIDSFSGPFGAQIV